MTGGESAVWEERGRTPKRRAVVFSAETASGEKAKGRRLVRDARNAGTKDSSGA